MYNISIVIYKSDIAQMEQLIKSVVSADNLNLFFIVDNSPVPLVPIERIKSISEKIRYIHLNGKNIGYGAAHNIAIRDSIYNNVPFHLVMNIDIKVQKEVVESIYAFMCNNANVGQVMPQVVDNKGNKQYLYKLLPTPLNLFARRFLPDFFSSKLNERYELRHLDRSRIINAPYLSGCFMFFRTEALLNAQLFDERFFLYAEDIDITRRVHRDYLTLYLPDLTIEHTHARASYHSFKMLLVHIKSVCRYFNKWGWFFDKERRVVNKITVEQQDKRIPSD